MKRIAEFGYPQNYKLIVRDSYDEDIYYALDDFDCRYLKIIQAKFGCIHSFHTIPDRVKMELAPFEWSESRQKFQLNENSPRIVQLNRLENMVISYSTV